MGAMAVPFTPNRIPLNALNGVRLPMSSEE